MLGNRTHFMATAKPKTIPKMRSVYQMKENEKKEIRRKIVCNFLSQHLSVKYSCMEGAESSSPAFSAWFWLEWYSMVFFARRSHINITQRHWPHTEDCDWDILDMVLSTLVIYAWCTSYLFVLFVWHIFRTKYVAFGVSIFRPGLLHLHLCGAHLSSSKIQI